jgi:hypothetical protein
MPLTMIYVNKYGGTYENVGPHAEPYINKKGESVTLNRWRSCCSFCGADFEVLYSSRLNPSLGWNNIFNAISCEVHRDGKVFKAPS